MSALRSATLAGGKVGEIFWLAYRQKINNYKENRLAFELKP
jgi:hypothetical protein